MEQYTKTELRRRYVLRQFGSPVKPQEQQTALTEAQSLLDRVRGSCIAKAVYTSRSEVTTLLRRAQLPGNPYKCHFCGGWHVTSMSRKAQKALMRKIRAASDLIHQQHSFELAS